MSFASLGLSEALVRATRDQGYETPSPIQAQAIPAVLSGGDVMAAAQTGTGKTAGFTLPLLQRLAEMPRRGKGVRALILAPTRELAAQVGESVALYGRHQSIRSAVVFGGVKINPQIRTLRQGVDVLVATPGRLLDLHQQGVVSFDGLETLVLDEADRMLDMGFIRDIRKVLSLLPKQRQNLLFSATFSPDIRKLAEGLLNDPVQVEVAARNTTAETVRQTVHPVDQTQKSALLSRLVHDNDWQQVLVFTRTKHGANRLSQKLERDGITAAAIHGNKSQNARTRALASFKDGDIRVLVATDIAARGLDIKQLPQVVNFELPNVPEDYVHRIGRTGRAGADGHAVSLVSADEGKLLGGIERLIKKELPREVVDGFEPSVEITTKGGPGGNGGRGRGNGQRNGGNRNGGNGNGRRNNRSRGRGQGARSSGQRNAGRQDG
ncbi:MULTISPECIES: DEAD/DEAH box helicase [Marinobacter]|uniref:DEAD/DEAH box helicase n=1 Tax=Marinobacter TaxID=2742 RepID=UPI000DADD113|nr:MULTISPECIES: DEAD/DEAH box helicase [Marinobacter]